MMNNILEMSLEEIRIENEKLYKNFIERCKDLKPKLRQIKKEIEANERMSKEEFYDKMNMDEPNVQLYEEYQEFVNKVCKEISASLANLSYDETEFGDDYRKDFGFLNKALSYHFGLKASHDYIDYLCDRFNDYLVELDD